MAESLRVESKDMSSYYTASEYASVNFKAKKKKDKKKSKRTREVDDDEGNGLSSLEMEISENGASADRGSRSSAATQGSNDELNRRLAYDNAARRANEKALAAKVVTIEDGDDADIAISLARARRVALMRAKDVSGDEEDLADRGAEKV